jgi:septal ring factor EnvC (AmiA/AmiB activator)
MGVGAFLVEEGQSVKAGEPVAAMAGANAELDLEIRKNGDPVNPSLWLSDNAAAEPAI